MKAVTDRRKCYVSVCVGCDLLFESERRDQLTCSPACRVRAHRNGSMERLRAHAKALDIPPASIRHAAAVRALCPELEAKIMARELTIEDAQPTVCRAFAALLLGEHSQNSQAVEI